MAAKRSLTQDELTENGYYWIKREGRDPIIAKLVGQAMGLGHSGAVAQIMWVYSHHGMMGSDSVAALGSKTKFRGPIKKPPGW